MTLHEIESVIEKQRKYFATGVTRDVKFRTEKLKLLKKALLDNEKKIAEALENDIGKCPTEGFMCETGLVISEINYMVKHIKQFSRDKRVHTPITNFCSRSFVKTEPYGSVLIISPWNYPVLLSFEPLVDAIAAGNTVVLKPAAYSAQTSRVIAEIAKKYFDEEYIAVVTGGREENQCLLDCKFDYIFFTGSKAVGKEVMKKASERLIPVTLELGGKSPCIVCSDADIKLSARRIVFGKLLNCGQTCVAPDYILCDKAVKERFVQALKNEIVRQYGKEPLSCSEYGKIVNEKHFDRICALIEPSKVVFGGKSCRETLKIEPTVMDGVEYDDRVMSEEIFGPVFPIIAYDKLEDALEYIKSGDKPLAFYIFTNSRKTAAEAISRCSFGGGCINDVVIHLASSNMGFGGVGESGMGAYHGKVGFDTFSHKKSVVDKKRFVDLPLRYRPYKKKYSDVVRALLKGR